MTYDLKARCNSCERFLKLKANESSNIIVTCPDRKCKRENSIKVIMLSDHRKAPK